MFKPILERGLAKQGTSLAHLFDIATSNDIRPTVVWNLNYSDKGKLSLQAPSDDPNVAYRINGLQVTIDGMTLIIDEKIASDWGLS